ncbi:MAG: 2-oxoacid:acceptor oxidoreductase family protein [Dehalococcoidia bacterium]
MADTQAGKSFPYPGTPATSDGTGMIVWVETHITQGACVYPITPSSGMGEGYADEVSNGAKNLWGETLVLLEPESEHSSASACEGYAVAGGRVVNFTCGQGLILMKEVLYTIAGKRLPVVFNIGARALTSQSLNIHSGHDDVMGVADAGWGILFARNAQETADLDLIARRAAEDSRTPFFNCQDGFLTTHTVESVLMPEPELMERFVGPPSAKLTNLIDPLHPVMSGVVQDMDVYMVGKIGQRYFYDQVPGALQKAMDEYYELTGRRYDMVMPYRLEDAEFALVGMGSAMDTAVATVDYLREKKGLPVGLLTVTAFRPFPGPQIVKALRHVKAFSVLEKLDVPLGQSNPLTAEVKAAFADAVSAHPDYEKIDRIPTIYSGSGGLGSRDVRPGHIIAIFENMRGGNGKRFFTVNVNHPTALPPVEDPDVRPPGSFSMRGHSVGGYGSITTNKIIASISSDLFGLKAQAYPRYGAEKKGLPTSYYLTLAKEIIRPHCETKFVDFVPVNDVNAFRIGNPLAGLAENGTVFIQTSKTDPAEVWADIPENARATIRAKNLSVLALDTAKIAEQVASRPDLVQRMQGIALLGVFLRDTPFLKEANVSNDELFTRIEKSLRKYFGGRGERVIQDNLECVRRGFNDVFEIPPEVKAKEPQALAADKAS